MHQSIATIDSPEFINLQPCEINPLMSACQIKVLYVGQNRNMSFITKDVAMEMAKTLRGAPIVGYYKSEKEDFADHGEKVIMDDEGVHFECMTKPYGFVAPDAQVWFQTFDDLDDFGNSVSREYLMTTGFLWTGQFEECADVINSGRPQSMELEEKSLKGHWSKDTKNGLDFFIINDAVFSKLCILGEDIEPCFEGASLTAPSINSSFSLNDEFKQTLFTMMQDLRKLVSEGGQKMDSKDIQENVEQEMAEVTEFVAEEAVSEEVAEKEVIPVEENQFKAKEEEEEKCKNKCKEDNEEKSEESEEDKEDKYALLQKDYDNLQERYSLLELAYNELVDFKANIENARKDELINSFDTLTEEDKSDVIKNKASYSYEEIEAKLSVIFTRNMKKNLEKEVEVEKSNEETNEVIATFNLNSSNVELPEWLKAVRAIDDNIN